METQIQIQIYTDRHTNTNTETDISRCSVSGFRQGVHTVSWTKTTSQSANPIALTFNDKVHLNQLINLDNTLTKCLCGIISQSLEDAQAL